MRKKVLVDLFYLNTALTGIKTYMLEFCEAVTENETGELDFVFTHDAHRQSRDTFFRGDVPYWRKLLYHPYYFIWKQILLPLWIWKEKPDILICFDFWAPLVPIKAKKLIVVHDAFFWQMPDNYNKIWRRYFLAFFYLGIKGNSSIITTSTYSKQALEKTGKIKKPIHVIYQCPKLLPEAPPTRVLTAFLLKKQQYFLHVGSFDKRKMLPLLVEAFGDFDKKYAGKMKLVLAGEKGLSAALNDYGKVLEKIKTLGLEEKVVLTGFLPDESIKTLYGNAFAYVFPSSNEGFGIPVLEAMSNGLPVIISDQEALVEVAGGAAMISRLGDKGDLTAAMEAFFTQKDLVDVLIQKGYERKEFFTRAVFYREFLKHIA